MEKKPGAQLPVMLGCTFSNSNPPTGFKFLLVDRFPPFLLLEIAKLMMFSSTIFNPGTLEMMWWINKVVCLFTDPRKRKKFTLIKNYSNKANRLGVMVE